MEWYVNIDGISREVLEGIGYYVVYEDEEFILINHKGDEQIIDKSGPKELKVDDEEAGILEQYSSKTKRRIPLPR